MFENLFKRASLISLHKSAPYANERERFLEHCVREGYRHKKIRSFACEILWAARKLNINPGHKVSEEQIKEAANDWKERERCYGQKLNHHHLNKRFIRATRKWLRFLGWLQEPTQEPWPFSALLKEFVIWMTLERGFSPSTIKSQSWHVEQFLRWYGLKKQSVDKVEASDIDLFLQNRGKEWARITKASSAVSLRTFFRFVEMKGWCNFSIVEAIHTPRIYSQENLPAGPSWENVQRLLGGMETEKPTDIRDRAIVMLFAVYGLRTSEVSKLRLEDIDWENDRILIRRAKRMKPQIYPLVPTVGNAIAKYLKKVRPQCAHREVFITLIAPFYSVSRSVLYTMVSGRIAKLGIVLPHKGPHSLRHACATHLISLDFSIKEIGDHLGHRSSSTTRIYAKVDIKGLREVAKFDLGDLR
jgi:integrase/recombinase XerD